MLLAHYLALVSAGGLLTAAWLFRPEERTAVTSLGAFLALGLAALLGGDVEATAGSSVIAAPVPDEMRLLLALWALLSGLALVLYAVGVYPPASESPVDMEVGSG